MFIVPISQMPSPQSIGLTAPVETPAQTENGAKLPFADVFQAALDNVRETQAASAQDAYDLSMGNIDDLHTVMIQSEKAATAIELTTQLASRAVNAYNEIIRMQV